MRHLQFEKKTAMKTIKHLLVSAALLLGVASVALAGPGPQYWQNLGMERQFKELKKGDKIAYVCNQCKTVSEIAVESPAMAMEHCKEGATVSCPVCKKTSKVVRKESRNDAPTRTEIVYVNDKGEECAFMAVAAKK